MASSPTAADGRPDGFSSVDAHTALEDLLAVIAHELRAPLAVVASAAEVVSTRELSPERLEALLDVIRRNAELAMLLTDRLGLARDVERGVFHLEPVRVDVAALTIETVADLGPTVAAHHAIRVLEAAPSPVLADETSLREILFNLLLNAVKYSPAGDDIEVAVTTADGQVELAVSDHGSGVAVGDVERIFGKYQQADGSAAGVGLGLFISRGLARANGGDLRVVSRADGGSSFLLTLPALDAPAVPSVDASA